MPDFQYTITLGELLAAIGAIVLVIVISWLLQRWHIASPLEMYFCEDPYDVDPSRQTERSVSTKLRTTIGCTSHLIRIKPREATQFGRVGVRFVQRRWLIARKWPDGRRYVFMRRGRDHMRHLIWEWHNVSPDEISIIKLFDQELDQDVGPYTGMHFAAWSDRVGGMWGEYRPAYFRNVEDSLWPQITVVAPKPWKGYLSFQASVIRPHRGYVRSPVTVLPQSGGAQSSPPRGVIEWLARIARRLRKARADSWA